MIENNQSLYRITYLVAENTYNSIVAKIVAETKHYLVIIIPGALHELSISRGKVKSIVPAELSSQDFDN